MTDNFLDYRFRSENQITTGNDKFYHCFGPAHTQATIADLIFELNNQIRNDYQKQTDILIKEIQNLKQLINN